MNELDLLNRQIQALKDLVEIQQRSINELQAQVNRLQAQTIISIPTVWTVPACQHEYPNPWGGTIPPHCKKCGQQSPGYTITCTNPTDNGMGSAGNTACGAW